MYAANSSILYSKERTVQILGTWRQYLVNVSGLRYSKQIKFQEELIIFWHPDFFKYLHFKYTTVSLKISHIINPFFNITSFMKSLLTWTERRPLQLSRKL